jgi:hypothetical protein
MTEVPDRMMTDEDNPSEKTNVETADATERRPQQAAKAPYMSYPAFKKLYSETLAADGIPGRFDKSYFGNVSGSLVAQIRGTLKYLELIDDQQKPTRLLNDLVYADQDGQLEILRWLFETKYADARALGPNATAGQLAEVFRERGLSGATVQKAITFFTGMADDIGAEVSPLFKKGRVVAAAGNGTRKRRIKIVKPPPPPTPATPHASGKPQTVEEQQKAAYVTMLMELAKNGDTANQEGLLDRIERALGIGAGPPAQGDSDLPQEE